MNLTNVINLASLPAPEVIETIDYETLLAKRQAALVALYPDLEAVITLESEPANKLLQESVYREIALRQRVNEAARATLLAFATGADLEHVAAIYEVQRLTIIDADYRVIPPTPAVMETDDRLRYRTQIAPESFTTAGPDGAYIFHGLSASASVADVNVSAPRFSRAVVDASVMDQLPPNSIVLQVDDNAGLTDPMPGDVAVAILSTEGPGTPDAELQQTVLDYLADADRVPMTDRPRIVGTVLAEFELTAELVLAQGPGADVVITAAQNAVTAYMASQHALGGEVSLSGLYAALHQQGVVAVDLTSPATNVTGTWNTAPYCTAMNITYRVKSNDATAT